MTIPFGWWAKAIAQTALASVPYGEPINHFLQTVRGSHSQDKTDQRLEWTLSFLEWSAPHVRFQGARIVEIGTGWDGLNPLVLAALGAKSITTYDHVPHLRYHMMRQVIAALKTNCGRLGAIVGAEPSEVASRLDRWDSAPDLPSLLDQANIVYRAPGNPDKHDEAIRGSDVFFSFAVLAHIPANELAGVHATAREILKPGGLMVHHVGLQDPFNDFNSGDNFKYLTISEPVWKVIGENKISGNNRLRVNQHCHDLLGAGGKIVAERRIVSNGDLERVARTRVIDAFRHIALEDLAVTTWDVVART